MNRISILAAIAGVFLLGAAPVQAADAPTSKLGTVSFSRLVQKLPAGKEWLVYQEGLLCVTKRKLKADGVQQSISLQDYGPIFMRELAGAGRIDRNERPNLFDQPSEAEQTTAYEIGALVFDMDVKLCGLAYGDANFGVKGSGSIKVQWQIYSTAKRSVVATIETTGTFATRDREDRAIDAGEYVLQSAFADSVRQLTVSPQFKALMDAPPPKDELRSTPGQQDRIAGVGATPAARPVAEATGSVVLVLLPDSHGSGVLVSSDGYVLTNAHVVGQNKTVKIRWSDGFETQGEVVRIHKARDVALVKTDTHGRQPLPTRTGSMQPGEAVLAIGAPLEMELQSTVTKGIVSANRILNGYSFIQSDVSVNHGNSGGALIDEKGFLVGLTDLGLEPNGTPVDLNFFIPIKDALDFLSLDLTPQPAPPPVRTVSAPVTKKGLSGG